LANLARLTVSTRAKCISGGRQGGREGQ
jgi:hypothetical protein